MAVTCAIKSSSPAPVVEKSKSGVITVIGAAACAAGSVYATNGFDLSFTSYFSNVRSVHFEVSDNGYKACYKHSTSKVLVRQGAAATAAPFPEFTNGKPMLETFYFVAKGDNAA